MMTVYPYFSANSERHALLCGSRIIESHSFIHVSTNPRVIRIVFSLSWRSPLYHEIKRFIVSDVIRIIPLCFAKNAFANVLFHAQLDHTRFNTYFCIKIVRN